MTDTVLVIGGYGVFGGRLAMRLATHAKLDVIVAGRDAEKAQTFCDQHGGRAAKINTHSDDLGAQIAALAPRIVIDAAGPFQAYGDTPYRVAWAAIACGAHYLDLSDDARFTSGISALDTAARQAGVAVYSGVSSVPALSSTVVAHLTQTLDDVHLIETQILPGNKAPRGRSVIAAILAQAGQPLQVWRGGRWQTVKGWSGRKRATLAIDEDKPITGRWASFIGAPDLTLFPKVFRARSVLFRAGLDLKLMHFGLAALSQLVASGMMRSLVPLTGTLKWFADRLEPFGSDRGGMSVRILGLETDGGAVERHWTLIADDGDGPHIPAVPAAIMADKLLSGHLEPGARPCLAAFTLEEAEEELSRLKVKTGTHERSAQMLFQDALKERFAEIPPKLKDLHTVLDQRVWAGRARVTRGRGLISAIAGAVGGFPPASDDIAVEVTMTTTKHGEVWTRTFGDTRFQSHLTRKADWPDGHVRERFGIMTFEIALAPEGDALTFPVKRGWCLGIPMPRVMLPASDTREYVDDEGRTRFDVSIKMPIGGEVVTYQGWLKPIPSHP